MRICKNNITSHLREHFAANPLKTPESRIKPMTVLEIEGKTSKFLGEFKYLVDGSINPSIPILEDPVAEISGKKTKDIDIEFGIKILDGFLSSFGIDMASISVGLNSAQNLKFSFADVRRQYIDPLQFSAFIIDNNIKAKQNNFMLRDSKSKKQIRIALVSDVIVSNNIAISALDKNNLETAINIPLIQNIAECSPELAFENASETEIKFISPDKDLTFAFSAFELIINPESNRFERSAWLNKLKSVSSNKIAANNDAYLNRIVLGENLEYPELYEIN